MFSTTGLCSCHNVDSDTCRATKAFLQGEKPSHVFDFCLSVQFRLIMGELPEGFGADTLLSAYVLLFLAVVFFFMLRSVPTHPGDALHALLACIAKSITSNLLLGTNRMNLYLGMVAACIRFCSGPSIQHAGIGSTHVL